MNVDRATNPDERNRKRTSGMRGPAGHADLLHGRSPCRRRVPGERPAVFGSVLSAILSCIAAPAAHSQNPAPGWNAELAPGEEPGTVEVSASRLNLRPGESVSYSLRLSKQPTGDGWWVRVFIDGSVRMDGYDTDGDGDVDITMVPSLGWEFDRDDWNQWREITIHAAEDANLDKRLQFDHDVWDHTSNCPVHGVGVVAVSSGGPTDDSRISVNFDRSSYEAAEGGDPATVTVVLGSAPQNRVVIPIGTSGLDGASSSDYSASVDCDLPVGRDPQELHGDRRGR